MVPEIVNILKGNDVREKQELLNGLCKRESEDPASYAITDQHIIDLVLSNIDDTVYEKDAVQLAGLNALPGYEDKMEARLLSGRSTHAGRIFYWLGKKASRPKHWSISPGR